MNKTSKSSGSSRRAPLKSTSAADTKAEKAGELVRMVRDPEIDARLAEGLPANRAGRREALRLAYYPPVEMDKQVVEWFAQRTGDRRALAFAINRVLIDYIDAWEREHKKAG